MIRITKTANGPDKLQKSAARQTPIDIGKYEADKALYATKALPINEKIYGSKTVKDELRRIQHNKCCFCEKQLRDHHGAVEHFRPKRGYKATPKGELVYPGYYWLCYSWKNLYLICSSCNEQKGNYFPLVREKDRANSHGDDVDREKPYLLDPGGPHDPRAHIRFSYQFVQASSKLGQLTIDACGLSRDALNEDRREHLKLVELLVDAYLLACNRDVELARKIETEFALLTAESAKFSAATTDYLRLRQILAN